MPAALVLSGLIAGNSSADSGGFETVPDQSPAQFLPSAMVSGTNFHVVDPDSRLVICGAFEAVYWTDGVATSEEQLRTSLPPQREGLGRELWLAGTISDRARLALQHRGWELHLVPDAPAEAAPQ